MKGKWKVSYNPMCGGNNYIVYRLRNVNEVDHSGNREYFGDYMASKAKAQAICDKLNSEVTDNG